MEKTKSRDLSLPDELRRTFDDLKRSIPPDQRQELESLFDLAQEMTAYREKHDEIEAAAQELDAYLAEFKALDMEAMADLAGRLFAEERFRPLRFSAQDIQRAFETVGYPSRIRDPGPEDGQILLDATLYLVDDTLRQRLARKLMGWLPEYVSAGRYHEASMLQYCAFQMIKAPQQGNPFLGEMLRHGFVEWANEIDVQQEEFVRKLGLNRADVAGMSPAELQTWLEKQVANPETKDQIETYLAAHPQLNSQLHTDYRELEKASLHILERADAGRFLLSPEEIEPWVPILLERLVPLQAQALEAAERQAWDDAGVQKAMGDALVEVALKMVPALFTPQRLGQLVADLRAYRNDLDAAGDKKAAIHAHTAASALEKAEDPSQERFVFGVCMASLRLKMIALGQAAEAESKSGGGTR
jgi:hypothetical protein